MPNHLKSIRTKFAMSLSILLILTQFSAPVMGFGINYSLSSERHTHSGGLADFDISDEVSFDTITGTLQGRVIDSGGLPLAGVRIRVINQETGNQRATLTNAEGRYQIAFLPLGRYTIQVSKDGFTTVQPTREPVKIQLNKTIETAPDIVMGPATAAQPAAQPTAPTAPTPAPPVTTPAAAPAPGPAQQDEASGRLANTIDSTRRFNGDEQMVQILPLANIRSFDDLALLAAGVAPPPEVKGVAGPGIGAGIGTAGQFSVNGQRARSNNFTVDGSDNNDEDVGVRRQGFVALVPQSIESVQEIQIVTHLWDAEQGRSVGSQVNAVSKSGTNQVHGAIYDFFNHDSLNARNFFDYTSDKSQNYGLTATAYERFVNGRPTNSFTLPVTVRGVGQVVQANPSLGEDQFQRNQGGGVIGFPIVKNRTFFFGSFERQDIKARNEKHFAVPTVAQRGFLNFGATGFTATGDAGQQADFTPTFIAGDSIFSLFPFPNNPIGPYGENTFTQVLPADAKGTIFSLKLDHSFTLFGPEVTHNFSARYNYTDDERKVPVVGGAIYSGVKPDVRTQNISLALTSQLSPTLANQMRGSYGRTRLRFDELRDSRLKSSRFLPNEPFLLNSQRLINLSFPGFSTESVDYLASSSEFDTESNLGPLGQVIVSPFSPVGLDVYLFPQGRANNTIQFADTLTKFRAAHTYKFGVDIRRTQLNSFLNRNYRPQVFFGGGVDFTGQLAGTDCTDPNRSPSSNPLIPLPCLSYYGPTPGFFNGSDLAALGIPTGIFQSLSIGPADSSIGLRLWQFNLFLNDNYRVRRGLTLDYGVRYELNTVPREVNSRIEDTFALDNALVQDETLILSAPGTGGRFLFDNSILTGSLGSTRNALNSFLAGREGIYNPDRNNFGGHLSFAWDPFAGNPQQAGKTVIRGGGGVYYDLTLGSVVSQSRNVFPNTIPINFDVNIISVAQQNFFIPGQTGNFAIFNPLFVPFEVVTPSGLVTRSLVRPGTLNEIGVPSGARAATLGLLFRPERVTGVASGGGLAFTLPEADLRSPMAFHYNLQIERELADNLLLNLAYVGSRGVKLTRFRTPNGGQHSPTFPIDPIGLSEDPILAIALPPRYLESTDVSRPTRPNPALGSYTVFDSSAASIYHSLQTTLTKRFSYGFQLSAAYTYSHAVDDVSDVFDVAGAFNLPQDDRNLRLERGDANFDIRHRLALSMQGNLPYTGRFNNALGAKRFFLGGWEYGLLATFQSGQPFTVNTSYDINQDGNLTDRLNTTAGIARLKDRREKIRVNVDPTSLLADFGSNGQVGRNTFRSSGVNRTDLALIKNFRVSETNFLVFRFEAFNLFNRSHFGTPVRILEAPSFGSSVDNSLNARQIQFALKYTF